MYFCTVEKSRIIQAFVVLGTILKELGDNQPYSTKASAVTASEYEALNEVIYREIHHNGWFTEDSIRQAFREISSWLTEGQLTAWTDKYPSTQKEKRVAIIMAGNIPLVGFHDFLCVLLSGHHVICKLSSDDARMLPALTKCLLHFEPGLAERIRFSDRKLEGYDAVIATGSNNSMLHFEQYFSHVPHLFRGHRTSVAVLTGNETKEELRELGVDCLTYFGRGCRNVTHLLFPVGFDLNRFFEAIVDLSDVVNNKKYGNNYDYNKAVHLMNLSKFLDNNFLLMKESDQLFSPLSMLHYQFYANTADLEEYLETHKNQIQCVVGQQYLPFGQAQCPSLMDYADGIDTMQFLAEL
ncbi:MAG: hypothetical protein RLZZ30_149 [Bacteroidota bacterium]